MERQLPDIRLEPESLKILIAHPDGEMRRRMVDSLDGEHCLAEVGDGQEAFEYAQAEAPDAIVAGWEMPRCSGPELCQRLREDDALQGVPVALLVPAAHDAFERAVEAGAAEVVTTPFSPGKLRLRVRNMVRSQDYLRELERKNRVILEALKDLRESEAMLVQADKLSLLGEMSAGIVHEINNPLNYSKSALFVLQRMLKDMEEGEERREYEELVGDVTDGLNRVDHIVKDLRAFATKGAVEMAEIDLSHVVRTASRLIGNRLSTINYVEAVPEGLLIRGNENNLCQVILNLIKNGVEATESAGRSLDGSEIRVTGEENSERVLLRVRDNGCGISDKARSRIFEPFFTTKDRNRGMGMGLSLCRRILEDHGATIEVVSKPGEFSEFILSFPPPQAAGDKTKSCG